MFYFCYFRALRLFFIFTSNSAVYKKIFLWWKGPDNGYATDYGTSRRFQNYDVIDTVTELPQSHSNYLLNTTMDYYSCRFTT